MSMTDRGPAVAVPALAAGDVLDAPTFHERYAAMPPSTRAELVGGVVHMPSPLFRDHGSTSRAVAVWLGQYQVKTPGPLGEDNTSTRLDDEGEVQPDHNLRIPPDCGGLARVIDGIIVGPPELVVEVSRSSRAYDLGPKKDQYERAGVRELIVAALDPDELYWFVLRDGRYERLAPGPDGLCRSEAFPGLWLDPEALFEGDLPRLSAAVDLGVATPEHAAFVARLARAGEARRP